MYKNVTAVCKWIKKKRESVEESKKWESRTFLSYGGVAELSQGGVAMWLFLIWQ